MTTFKDNTNTFSTNNGVTDAKLVREVEKHPALYNPKRRGYKDAAEMDRSWLQIANELGMKRKSPSLLLKYSAITLAAQNQRLNSTNTNPGHERTRSWASSGHFGFSHPYFSASIFIQCPSPSRSSECTLSYENFVSYLVSYFTISIIQSKLTYR
jgi:hypothetical protein